MEILSPQIPEVKQETRFTEPVPESPIPLSHVEILAELGLKDKLFDSEIMDKIAFISERADLDRVKELSLKVGNDGWISKLDKIYSYLQLSEERDSLRKKQDLITDTLRQYEQPNSRF